MLLEMLEMLEREFKGGSNPQEDDEDVARDHLIIVGSTSIPLHTFRKMALWRMILQVSSHSSSVNNSV
jgi:hypothetical protein